MKIRITGKRKLPKAQIGGECPQGYMKDPNGNCVPELQASQQPNYNWTNFNQAPTPKMPTPKLDISSFAPSRIVSEADIRPEEMPPGYSVAAPQQKQLSMQEQMAKIGLAPDRVENDPVQKQTQSLYNSNPEFARSYDANIGNSMVSNLKPFQSHKDLKNYTNWYNDKYGTDKKVPFMTPDRVDLAKKVGSTMTGGLFAANAIAGIIDQKKQKKETERAYRDSLFSMGPVDSQQNRGDYEINTGMVDPYNTGAKSKGQFTDMFYPMAQDGISMGPIAYSDNPVRRNVFQQSSAIEVPTARPEMPVAPTAPNKKSSYTYSGEGSKSVSVNKKAQDAYQYYIQKHNLDPHIAAGIVANLVAESNLKTTAKEQGNTQEGRGVAQWNVNDRWASFLNWADKNQRDPYDLYTQLDYVIVEPGEGKKALNALKNTKTAGDAAYTFGKVYERPNEKFARWNERVGMAEKLSQMTFQEGGEYDNSNNYTQQMGGQTYDNMKIRITRQPNEMMAYGGQMGYGFDTGSRRIYTDMPENKSDSVSRTMGPVDPSMATIEAEKGETILSDVDGDGMQEHMNIGGKRHSQGGTPIAANPGDFVFSDTKKMKIKDPEILKFFNKSKQARGITPAQIAKQYDINKYKAVVDDPYADPMSKKTAQMMIDNYKKKLGALAMVQEGMKGFPNGIPDVARSIMSQGDDQMPQAKYGGYMPKYVLGGPDNTYEKAQQLGDKYPWLKPWLKSNTVKGRTSPTGKTTTFNDQVDNVYNDINEWEKVAGRKFHSLEDMQGFVYSSLDQNSPDVIQGMWKDWGHTAKTGNEDVNNFVDKIMGGRTAALLRQRVPPASNTPPSPVQGTPPPVNNVPPPINGTPPSPVTRTPPGTPFVPNAEVSGSNIPYGWTQQDKNNLGLAMANRFGIKKYQSVRRDFNPVLPDFRNMDWRGKAAELQGTFNSQMNTMGSYGSPNALAANASFMAGQQAENLINRAIEPTEQQNVQLYNQVAAQNAGIMNQALANNAQNTFLRSQDRAIMNQNYDNAMRDNNKAMVMSLNQGITNAAGMYNTNLTESPYYYYDPRFQTMQFNSGNAKAAFESAKRNASDDGSFATKAMNFKKTLEGLDPEDQKEIMKMWYAQQMGGKSTQTTYPFNTRNNKVTVQQPASMFDYNTNPFGQ